MLRLIAALLMIAAPLGAQERVPSSQAEITLSFAPVVRDTAPAVVNIFARRVVQSRSPFMEDPFFDGMFRELGTRPRVQNSLGSGVILSDDGIIVSNFHVVGQATDIQVVLSDRREYNARVLLGDRASDLAILKLEGARDMPFLALRDSDTVEVGELVLAIGNPFGVGQTVSSGIVSGLARSGGAAGTALSYFIQTDAPINPGNSGGALVDMAGRLIGVNTSILTRSGGSNGIGFAIPAALVEAFKNQARDGATRFTRPWAGITGQAVDADMAETFGLDRPVGIVLSRLHPASPFRDAGLTRGDVILSINDQEVNAPAEMIYRMTIAGIGTRVDVGYMRRGRLRTTTAAMIAPPDTPDRARTTLQDQDILPELVVLRINPAVIDELGLPGGVEGVVVDDPGPVGARIGLRRGDILRAVNGRAVEAPRDLGPLLRRAGPRVGLDVQRGGQRVSLRFRI